MIVCVYGTTGELIKLVPFITELKKRDAIYCVAFVQQEEQLKKFFAAYPDIPKPDLWLSHGYRNKDLDKFFQMPIWLVKSLVAFSKNKKTIKQHLSQDRTKDMVIVHGDTVTTVFGAYVAWRLKRKLGHIEAGLRSFDIWNPFPEELDRRIVSKLARVHFAPGKAPIQNLHDAKAKGDIVDTKANTVYDSLHFAGQQKPAVIINDLPEHFGIVSIHRNELLVQTKVFTQTIKTLAEYSSKQPMVFLQHPITLARIKALGLEKLLEDNFIFVPKLDYFSFVNLLHKADYAVTDSGGLQEECTYINKPCLIHRKATERMEGLEEGITKLSYYNDDTLREFLDNPSKLKIDKPVVDVSPTKIIIDYLDQNDFIARPR